MTNKPKAIGTAGESAVVRVFKDAGFRAKRLTLRGSSDVGDIDIGLDSVVVEVKSGAAAEKASDGQVQKWMIETAKERENANAEVGILVMKRKGIGPANAGQWWAITTLCELDILLCTQNPLPESWYYTTLVRIHLSQMVDILNAYALRSTR